MTLHRPANVDDTAKLGSLLEVLAEIARKLPVVFPVHPRTRQRMESIDFPRDGILLAPPMGYLEFLGLMGEARLILTDSGGIQEESTLLGVPCLTMRRNTERPITIERGTTAWWETIPRQSSGSRSKPCKSHCRQPGSARNFGMERPQPEFWT